MDRPPTFVVSPGEIARLDQFLIRHIPGLSRRRTRAIIASGAVRVNGRAARKGQWLRAQDVVALDASAAHLDARLMPQEELSVRVLLADASIVAVAKPAGMPAVALQPTDRDTLANFLVARFPETAGIGKGLEAGLVHRLDTATSGVMLAARTGDAHAALRRQFAHGEVDKRYLAVVVGDVRRNGTVRTPIAHRPHRPREMCVCRSPDRARALHARPAATRIRPLRRWGAASLVAVTISTGVRHQVRVHLASIGHPVLGDSLYGTGAGPEDVRLMLHAARLRFRHPATGLATLVRCRAPADFRAALGRLVGEGDS